MHFLSSLFHHSQIVYITFFYKVVILAGLISAVSFIAQYTRYAPWWKDPIGKRIVYETLAIVLLYIPTTLSLFFNLNRLTSDIIAWYDISILGFVALILMWGMVVWKREKDYIQQKTDGENNDSTGDSSDSI